MVEPGLVSLIELAVLAVGVAIAILEIRNMGETRKAGVHCSSSISILLPNSQKFGGT